MRGYWADEAATAKSIDGAGFMHTGDLATLDAEGYCNIVGRIKDVVIRGGENIYPREVEEFLYTHPAIADVQTFGVPDSHYGEQLCAWIRLKDGAALNEMEVVAFCKANIAHYKAPKYVRFVQDFPMTVTGKVQKFVMRERMIEELGLVVEKTAVERARRLPLRREMWICELLRTAGFNDSLGLGGLGATAEVGAT